jgi:Ubiquitin carboxyl-terminal hydrolase
VTDEQVASHFSTKRPILGICLKRYFMSPEGIASRLNTYIDIPLEIALPHFISDGSQDDGFGSSFTNFKLVLQSVICHRGTSVFAGHYVSLVRPGPEEIVPAASKASPDDGDRKFQWFLFDDLATQRVKYVDVRKALKDECPYLVFYQVQPINGSSWPSLNQVAPPTYDEATKSTPILDPISDPPSASDQSDAAHSSKASATSSLVDLAGILGATLQPSQTAPPSISAIDSSNLQPISIDLATLSTPNHVTLGRKSMDINNKRSSVTFTESIGGPSAPITPGEELSLKEGYMSSKDGTPGKDERGRGHHKDRDTDKEKRHGSRWLSVRRRSRPASQPPIENRRPTGVGVGDIAKALRGAMSRDKLPVGPDSHAEAGSAVDDVADGVNAEGEPNAEVATATNGTAAPNGSVNVNITPKGKDKLAFTRRRSTKKGKGRAHSVAKDDDVKTNGEGLPGGLPERQCIVM